MNVHLSISTACFSYWLSTSLACERHFRQSLSELPPPLMTTRVFHYCAFALLISLIALFTYSQAVVSKPWLSSTILAVFVTCYLLPKGLFLRGRWCRRRRRPILSTAYLTGPSRLVHTRCDRRRRQRRRRRRGRQWRQWRCKESPLRKKEAIQFQE